MVEQKTSISPRISRREVLKLGSYSLAALVAASCTRMGRQVLATLTPDTSAAPTQRPTLEPTESPTLVPPTPALTLEQQAAVAEYAPTLQAELGSKYANAYGINQKDIKLHKQILGGKYAFQVTEQGDPIAMLNEEGKWEDVPLKYLAQPFGMVMGSDTRENFSDVQWQKILVNNFTRATISPGLEWFESELTKGNIDFTRVHDQVDHLKAEGITDFVGHPLIDQRGLPDWLVNGNFSKEDLQKIMKNRIEQAIIQNPDIDMWVVINEPYLPPSINPDRSHDIFYKAWGSYDYITEAFQIARDISIREKRDVTLIFNDGDNHYAAGQTSESSRKIVKMLKDKNLIDYVGMQMHIGEWEKNAYETWMRDNISNEFQYYNDLNVPILITEISYYPSEEAKKLSDVEFNNRLAMIFKDIAGFAIDAGVKGMSYWDMTDYYEVDRNNEYTMFDKNGKPKKAFYEVRRAFFDRLLNN